MPSCGFRVEVQGHHLSASENEKVGGGGGGRAQGKHLPLAHVSIYSFKLGKHIPLDGDYRTAMSGGQGDWEMAPKWPLAFTLLF